MTPAAASWKKASTPKSVVKKSYGAIWEWLATFENPALAGKKMLYVFMQPSGVVIAVNHTGK